MAGNLVNMRRRDFLKVTASIGGGMLISFHLPTRAKTITAETHPLNDLLLIGADNSVTVLSSKVEMGQGIFTTLPMLIAEELDCDWKNVKVQYRLNGAGKDFSESLYRLSTGGSDSTRGEFERYRLAGATARTMLITAAAKRWNISPEKCRTRNGYVEADNRKFSFGELVSDAASLPVPTVSLRDASQWKVIGTSRARLDMPDKVNGKAVYGMDIQFPGLLTAVVAHPPAFGATVVSWDASKARAISGVRKVVQVPDGIAVLADNFWAAKKGRDVLEIKWDQPEGTSTSKLKDNYRSIAREKGRVTQTKGNVDTALGNNSKAQTYEYTFPFLAHAPMETLNCTVRLHEAGCEIWCGTQSPIPRQMEVAKLLNCDPEKVQFHTPTLGGSFGRKGSFGGDWVIEAVRIAQASGEAIKLVWSREDDIKGGYYRPYYLHSATVGVDAEGYPNAWHHHVVGQSLFVNTVLEKDIVVDGIDYSTIGGIHGSPYLDSVPDHRVELHTTKLNVPVLPWRSVGHTHIGFAMETLVDELAAQANKDPIEYRRKLLSNQPRLLGALNLAAEKASWGKLAAQPPGTKVFQGVAVHGAMNSYVCQIVEVSMEGNKPKIHRVVCAIDCGIAVNPEGIRAQMESGIIFGLTAALYGAIDIEDGRVKQRNFNDYKMLRFNECPVIEVHIVPGRKDVCGAGEPGVPPIAPALGNALFAATGKRQRELPFRFGA